MEATALREHGWAISAIARTVNDHFALCGDRQVHSPGSATSRGRQTVGESTGVRFVMGFGARRGGRLSTRL